MRRMTWNDWNPYRKVDIWLVLAVLCICLILVLFHLFRKTEPDRQEEKRRRIWRIILWFYLFTICCVTVLGREETAGRRMELELFWCIKDVWHSHRWSYWQNIVGNIVLFMPFGCLLPLAVRRCGRWYRVLLLGFLLSVSVETVQYVARIGLCELDDVLHNTWGTGLGCQVYYLFSTRGQQKAAVLWKRRGCYACLLGTFVLFGGLFCLSYLI